MRGHGRLRGSSEPEESVVKVQLNSFTYLSKCQHRLGEMTGLSSAERKANRKLFNNLDNDDSPD